ncbi:MAG: DEAD/DEAH box helicase [Alphaproteobacteria bacterium]|nr:DEAD/DEAH box helicase [Alphaproteobacteria bacterium]
MSFATLALHPLVLKALDVEGYSEATPVQAAAIPPALEGQDILATAATGTGKTAAFVLPALTRIASTPKTNPSGAPRVLVLAPTRELAAQVTQAVRKHGRFMRVSSADIVGGMPYRDQLRWLSKPLDVVVATPGRLIDHLQRGRLDLGKVEVLVLDEADRMLDMGFAEDVDAIARACSPNRQTLLFTATLDKRMAGVAARLLKSPVRVAVDRATSSADIEQRLYFTNHVGHKRRLLEHFAAAAEVSKAIVFVATKRDCDNLAQDLNRSGHRAAALHGDMHQRERNRTLQQLKTGDLRLLVATDVASRGIDVRDISHVINFDLPRGAEDYVHRIGRTGRAGATGIAMSFVGAAERGLIRNIERLTRVPIAVHVVPGLEPSPMANHRPAGRPEFRHGRPHGRPNHHHAGQQPEGEARPARSHPGKPHAAKPWVKRQKLNRDKGRPVWANTGTRPR